MFGLCAQTSHGIKVPDPYIHYEANPCWIIPSKFNLNNETGIEVHVLEGISLSHPCTTVGYEQLGHCLLNNQLKCKKWLGNSKNNISKLGSFKLLGWLATFFYGDIQAQS